MTVEERQPTRREHVASAATSSAPTSHAPVRIEPAGLRSLLPPLLALAITLGAWEAYIRAAQVPLYLVPAPSEIGRAHV